jgi:hypothetical protein
LVGAVLVFGILAGFILLAALLPRATPSDDGIPRPVDDDSPSRRIHMPPPEVFHRLARGSTAPSSLIPAVMQFGELQGRRMATPQPSHDDGWDPVDGQDKST